MTLTLRRSRAGRNPFSISRESNMDSGLRRNDGVADPGAAKEVER
jgi:hypothetical protein